jgi:hypothetical protein
VVNVTPFDCRTCHNIHTTYTAADFSLTGAEQPVVLEITGVEDRDLHGGFVECLQCGYVLSNNETAWLYRVAARQVERAKVAA